MATLKFPFSLSMWVYSFFGLFLLVTPFVFSGDWAWAQGWIFLAAMLLGTAAIRMIANIVHPGIQKERMTAGSKEGVMKWDHVLMPLSGAILPFLTAAVAGLDHRLGWSMPLPVWLNWTGLGMMVLGMAAGAWILSVNRYFSSYVRIQRERGQTVVSTGPYSVIRHPGYLAHIVTVAGMTFLLGSPWALSVIPFLVGVILIRIHLEEDMLLNELPGYREYAARVRYRLIPGVW